MPAQVHADQAELAQFISKVPDDGQVTGLEPVGDVGDDPGHAHLRTAARTAFSWALGMLSTPARSNGSSVKCVLGGLGCSPVVLGL